MIEKGSHTTESDQSLLDALIKGEETAFEKIYKSYFALLQNYSASIVGDSEAALEIIQNIFVALWENRKNLDREKSLRNYLLRSTHNNSLRYLKTRFLHLQHQENLKRKKSEEEQENVIRAEEGPEPEQQKCRYCPKIRHFRPDSRNHPLPGNEKTSGKNKKIVFSNT